MPGAELWAGARPRLTFYPVDRTSAPAFVVCPGGGYEKQAEHEGEPVAQWLNSLGVAAFVLSYRVYPDRHPLPLRDGHRAVRWARHHAAIYDVDAQRVGVLGFSAGGHLAACVAAGVEDGLDGCSDRADLGSSRPALAALCYPVVSFVEAVHERSLENLLGEGADDATRRALSAELQVDADTPPSFIWHTADDAKVGVANSLLFARALADAGVPVELHVFSHGGHGLGLARDEPSVSRWTTLFETWLRSHRWLEPGE